jgi:Amidohydrolase family
MVTTNPVKAMGISGTGAIRENYDADLFVFRKAAHTDNALDTLLTSTDNDIEFVMVNGRIVFGLTSYFDDQLKVDYQGFSPQEGSHIARRGVSINSNLHFDLAGSLNIIDTWMHRYCSTVIDKPHLKRTRFLASDDTLYQHNIRTLKEQLAEIYPPGSGLLAPEI